MNGYSFSFQHTNQQHRNKAWNFHKTGTGDWDIQVPEAPLPKSLHKLEEMSKFIQPQFSTCKE